LEPFTPFDSNDDRQAGSLNAAGKNHKSEIAAGGKDA